MVLWTYEKGGTESHISALYLSAAGSKIRQANEKSSRLPTVKRVNLDRMHSSSTASLSSFERNFKSCELENSTSGQEQSSSSIVPPLQKALFENNLLPSDSLDNLSSIIPSYDCPIAVANNNSSQASTPIPFTNSPYFNPTAFPVNKGPINWKAIIWVQRGPTLWLFQTIIAIVCLMEALLLAFLGNKVLYLAEYYNSRGPFL
ncbi:Potassium channel subfamily T member 1-like protein [Dinothrombium tinctorium]|uniref:Potassium channel subfamily T member 1-like protein n=1 Tax=Dinothrombium tinctorium TaxID=1965070 RepID=A0A443R4D6_9ACAR|nr:Potassium channel subfamily T member 1-like protein [Dinothrombium tinctorium]